MTSAQIASGGRICAAPSFPYLPENLISVFERDDGVFEMSAPGAFDLPVTCTYWEVEDVRSGDDRWRYKLTPNSRISQIGPYSHVSARGCQIAIWKHFIDIGLIDFPKDNSHLDEIDAAIAKRTKEAWMARSTTRPRTGDFFRLPDGTLKRFCKVTGRYAQTTTALRESYYIGVTGDVSYSGSLEPGIDIEDLVFTADIVKGQFWFFHHGRSGPGRAVRIALHCEVWTQLTQI